MAESIPLDLHTAAEIAQRYFNVSQPLVKLGWGISGFVFLSPDLRTAVKVHREQSQFERELFVYRRLRALRINRVQGLTVPKLRDAKIEVKLLRMDFVSPPFLLDFAGVRLGPPDFPEDTMQLWHADIEEKFGPNAHVAYAVYNTLMQHGLYYMDFRPSNMNLTGLPGLIPYPPSGEIEP